MIKHPVLYRIVMMILFAAYLAAVTWICFGPGKTDMDMPQSIFGIPFDKCVHFLMFLPFPILGTLAFNFRSWWRSLSITTLIANAIAFSFENLQSVITTNRVTDPADLNANVLGIATGLLIMVLIGLIRPVHSSSGTAPGSR